MSYDMKACMHSRQLQGHYQQIMLHAGQLMSNQINACPPLIAHSTNQIKFHNTYREDNLDIL